MGKSSQPRMSTAGMDWQLIYRDTRKKSGNYQTLGLFDTTTIDDTLCDAEDMFVLSETEATSVPPPIIMQALYSNRGSNRMCERLSQYHTTLPAAHLVWYQVLSTGTIQIQPTIGDDLRAALANSQYPEVPVDADAKDYIEILGIARADTNWRAIT